MEPEKAKMPLRSLKASRRERESHTADCLGKPGAGAGGRGLWTKSCKRWKGLLPGWVTNALSKRKLVSQARKYITKQRQVGKQSKPPVLGLGRRQSWVRMLAGAAEEEPVGRHMAWWRGAPKAGQGSRTDPACEVEILNDSEHRNSLSSLSQKSSTAAK